MMRTTSLAALVEERAARSYDRLLAAASDVENGSQLVVAIGMLQASAEARQLNSLQLTSYFGAQFGDIVMAGEAVHSLIEQRGAYRLAMDELRRITGADTETSKALAELKISPEVIAFHQAVDVLIADPPVITTDGGLDLARIFAQLDTTAATFQTVNLSTARHVALVSAAAADVQATSRALEDLAARGEPDCSASHRNRGIDLADVCPGSRSSDRTAVASARPAALNDCAMAIDQSALRPSGPKEVRQAMLALNEAEAHIELAERQASALALGELQSPALMETTPGSLGRSLHHAVRTLASSLNDERGVQALAGPRGDS